jgi:dipeptidase D
MDMVCIKTQSSDHDFNSDPIQVVKEDGWLHANNTTLGSDNGIGIAIAMYMGELESHPKLELLITVSEETGME